jgi:glutathione-specific gamma-glutamylcyclotransferase
MDIPFMNSRDNRNVWIFAYGSLMWEPNFPYRKMRCARLYGYHRALCIFSIHYRGTPECPGLVLGLDRGGSCRGLAFLIEAKDRNEVLSYLNQREQISGVYEPKFLPVLLDDGSTVQAHCFIAKRDHEQYAGKLALNETARLVSCGHGKKGSSLDYLKSTIAHMDKLMINGPALRQILSMAERMARKKP